MLKAEPGNSWNNFQFSPALTRGQASSVWEPPRPPHACLPVHLCTSASPFHRPQTSTSRNLCGS